MVYAAEVQQVLERYAREIDDLRTIAKMHGLPTGVSENLAVLPLRLSQDARLRSDVAELVRSLQTRDPDLGLPDVLSIVLTAVAGSAKLDRQRDLEEAIDLTGGFLASLGGWPGSAVEPIIDIDHPPDHDPRLDLDESAYADPLESEHARQVTGQEEVTITEPASDRNDQVLKDPDGAVTLAEITHALARLERGNVELRLHLDSIDQRICRMEPLLEAAPHPEPPLLQPDPPPRNPLPSPLLDSRDLVHRGSTPSDPGSPRDRLEEVKALRRISLQSSFLDSAAKAAPPPVSAAAPLPHNAGISVTAGPSTPAGDVAPASTRSQQPRRDRFAAAREIPGNSAETDPLYIGLPQEEAPVHVPEISLGPEPVEATPPVLVPAAPAPEKPASAPVVVAEETAHTVHPDELPSPSGSRAWLRNDASSASKQHPVPGPWKVTPPSVAMIDVGQRKRGSAATWVAGVTAAVVIGAAGFLYINGLPSTVSDWIGGSHSAVTSDGGKDRNSPPGDAQIAGIVDPDAAPEHAVRSRSAQRGASSADTSGRVLAARESLNPSASVEKISGPTFVPAGVMDGYLVAAPRPVYPEMAKLVGSQGKVTFEAMVSKAGQVEAVKVLGGPQILRSAATDAVKQWQYRPFEVKGRPVEVRTIIRVDVGSHAGSPATE